MVTRTRASLRIHAEEARHKCGRQEGGGEGGEDIELAVGFGGELGVDLVVEESGAGFHHFKVLVEVGEPGDDGC